MKKILVFLSLILLVIGLASAQAKPAQNTPAQPAAAQPAAEKTEKTKDGKAYYVAVKTITLKTGTGAFAENVKGGTLSYGAKVTQIKVDGNYIEVKSADNPSVTGWVTIASLTTKQIVAGTAASTTTAKEVALAGKGFSQEAEKTLSQKKELNYADVDKVEAIKVREKDIEAFLKEGDLKMGKK